MEDVMTGTGMDPQLTNVQYIACVGNVGHAFWGPDHVFVSDSPLGTVLRSEKCNHYTCRPFTTKQDAEEFQFKCSEDQIHTSMCSLDS